MLRDDMTPKQYRIRFYDNDVERTQYADDRRYYEQLIAQHGHLSDLRIEPLALTTEQQRRLDDIKPAGLDPHEASLYVQYGSTEDEETGYYDAGLIAAYHRAQVEPEIKAQRKRAETVGVTLNGVRYAGDPDNRTAMQEALNAVNHSGAAVFPIWKDSDGNTHLSHPASDVLDALVKIGGRRSALMAKEAEYVAQAAGGEMDVQDLDWRTAYDD